MTSLLVPIVRYPEPLDADTQARGNSSAARALDLWRNIVATEPDADADREDFWEGAYRLLAAVDSGADELWLATDQRAGTAHLYGNGALRPIDDVLTEDDVIVYGSVARFSSRELTTRYHVDNVDWVNSVALRPHLGRRVSPCGFMEDPNDPADISHAMATLASNGDTEAFIKTRKKGMHAIVPVTGDIRSDRNALFDAFEWETVRLEDDPCGFLVSEVTPMRFEYRMYLVDGVPVTAAANIEEHTPLDAIAGEPFATVMQERRGASVHSQQVGLRDRYVEFATRVGADLVDEGVLPRVLNLDVALGPDDEPLVVEVHSGLINTGLFATDPVLFLRTVVESTRPAAVTG